MPRASSFFALAALPLALLSGCMNLAPSYRQPDAPVPAAWPAPEATPLGGSTVRAPLNTGWRDFFVDERLREVVALALANNRDLRVAALNIARAEAQYGVTQAALLPGITAGAGGSRARTPGSTATSGQSRIATQFNANLALTSYEIDLFGRVRNLSDAALETFFATAET